MNAGLLLLSGPVDGVAKWARRGLVATDIRPIAGWVAVRAIEETSRAEPPYDGGLMALAARPVGSKLRPAVGLFDIDGFGLLTLHPKGRGEPGALMWSPHAGAGPVADQAPLVPADLVRSLGGTDMRTVARALAARPASAHLWLLGLIEVLRLPGAALLAPVSDDSGRRESPTDRSVRAFDQLVVEERAHAAELQEKNS